MNKKVISAIAGIALATSSLAVVRADTAYTATFTTAITYQNVGNASASIVLSYYAEGSGSPITVNLPALAPLASSSIFAGNVASLPAGFKGSAVLSSDQPIAATLVQISTGAGTSVKNRPLSNGFASGSSSVLLATVLKQRFNTTSRFYVQNTDSTGVDLTIKIFDADNAGNLVKTLTNSNVPSGSSISYDLGTIVDVPANFSGSATIEAKQTGTANPGKVVASVVELSVTGIEASSFEGVSGGANTVYMASALCNAFGGFNSFYAVQNTGAAATTVTVTYNNGASQQATINPGAKQSFATCSATGMTQGFSGSATISSTGPIVALGKVNGLGVSSAFLGAFTGAAKLSLPYVRWTPTAVYNSGQRQRAYIAVQNIGGNLAAGQVTVRYVDKNGTTLGSQPLGALNTGDKQSIKSADVLGDVDFGFYSSDGSFGGGAIVEGPAGSQLVAVVRIQSANPGVGEDFNGILIQ